MLGLPPKIQNSHVYESHVVALLGSKSARAQYNENERGEKNGKDRKDRKNERGEKCGGAHRGNEINPVV